MHEYSIVQALMRRVEAEARKHEAVSVGKVELDIGELSGVETELLRTAFETFKGRTICAEAELEIEVVPARWVCSDCGRELPPGTRLQCADCGNPGRLESGDEILLRRLELQTA